MPNKCTVVGCRSGYKKKKDEPKENVKQPVFCFPEDLELRKLWIRFVNRPNWLPGEHHGICKRHFEQKYLVVGKQRITLNRRLKPSPTIYPKDLEKELLNKPSLLPTPISSRKPPTSRNNSLPDEIDFFNESDDIKSFEMLNELCAPSGFLFQRFPDHVLYYKIFYEESSSTPFILV